MRPENIADELRFYTDEGIEMLNELLEEHGLRVKRYKGQSECVNCEYTRDECEAWGSVMPGEDCQNAKRTKQIIKPGDGGSVAVTPEGMLAGLIFAGTGAHKKFELAEHLRRVEDEIQTQKTWINVLSRQACKLRARIAEDEYA